MHDSPHNKNLHPTATVPDLYVTCHRFCCFCVSAPLQATADHFVLVGSTRPAYKRAGKVVVGDTLWMSVPGCSQLVPAVVTKVHSVANTGLYAPITVSGSIIVNDIAASVHRLVRSATRAPEAGSKQLLVRQRPATAGVCWPGRSCLLGLPSAQIRLHASATLSVIAVSMQVPCLFLLFAQWSLLARYVCPLCSNWFADSAWSALGLPEAWLPALYQAVLAPVRLLWHILPNYKEIYTRVEQTYGITATVPTLSEFVGILVWVLRDVMGQSGSVLATTATLALVARTASKGKEHDEYCRSQ